MAEPQEKWLEDQILGENVSEDRALEVAKLREKVVKDEAKLANQLGNPKIKYKLKPEDIIVAGDLKKDELSEKEKLGELSPEEGEELEMRRRGDLFYKTTNFVESSPIGGDEGGPRHWVTKYFTGEHIVGMLDGEVVELMKKSTDRTEMAGSALGDEIQDEEGKVLDFVQYLGSVGGKTLWPQEAKELFLKYVSFARKRTDELVSLRESTAELQKKY